MAFPTAMCDGVRHDRIVPRGIVRNGMEYGLLWFMVWYGMEWYWHGMGWYTVWYGTEWYVTAAPTPHLAVGVAVNKLSFARLAVRSGQNALNDRPERQTRHTRQDTGGRGAKKKKKHGVTTASVNASRFSRSRHIRTRFRTTVSKRVALERETNFFFPRWAEMKVHRKLRAKKQKSKPRGLKRTKGEPRNRDTNGNVGGSVYSKVYFPPAIDPSRSRRSQPLLFAVTHTQKTLL